MPKEKKKNLNKKFKNIKLQRNIATPNQAISLTRNKPSRKEFIYKSDFKLSKSERSEKEFEKANFILQTKRKSFFNGTFKNRAMKLANRLLMLEKEKKNSYWRLKLTSRYCAWRYLQKFKKQNDEQEQIEQKKIKNGDLIFWFKAPTEEFSTPTLTNQLTDLYPKTRAQKIKKILNAQLTKKQIHNQLRQSTLAFLLEKEGINRVLQKNILKKNVLKKKKKKPIKNKILKLVKKRKVKNLIKKRKYIVFLKLKKTKIKQLKKKKKQQGKAKKLQKKNIINFISNLKTKNKWLKIKKTLTANMANNK